jgi:hypothetical protein
LSPTTEDTSKPRFWCRQLQSDCRDGRFQDLEPTGITLSSGQQVSLELRLEVGAIEETITVTGEAPLLETNAVNSGMSLSTREVESLPTMANMPVMLARLAPGMAASGNLRYSPQGFVGVPSGSATPLGGVGGNEYSIDGATNNGVNDRWRQSPNGDMIQEMRVESTSFTASVGHGTGRRDFHDDAGGYEHASRHGQLPVLDQQDQPAELFREEDLLSRIPHKRTHLRQAARTTPQ